VFEGLGQLIEAIEEFPSYETLTVELFAIDPFAARSDALVGITEVSFDFPEYVVYGEREESAILVPPETNGDGTSDW